MDLLECLLAVTAVLVVCTNGPLLFVLFKDRTLRTQTTFQWLTALCLVDLSTGVVSIPVSFILGASEDDITGSAMPLCLFLTGLRMLSKHVAMLGLLGITVDRFVAIRFPFFYHSHMSGTKVLAAMCGAWLTGLLVVELPLLGWNNGWTAKTSCSDVFKQVLTANYRLYFKLIAAYVAPMIVICVIYAYLFLVIRRHARQIQNQESAGSLPYNMGQEIRAAKTFALYTFVFIVCLYPVEVLVILQSYYNVRVEPWNTLHPIAITAGLSVSVCNPLLYVYTNSTLRLSVADIFPLLRPCLRVAKDAAGGGYGAGGRRDTGQPQSTVQALEHRGATAVTKVGTSGTVDQSRATNNADEKKTAVVTAVNEV